MAFLQVSHDCSLSFMQSLPCPPLRLLQAAPYPPPAARSPAIQPLRIVSSQEQKPVAQQHPEAASSRLIDRRQFLTAAPIAAASLPFLSTHSLASPILAPDLADCGISTIVVPPGSSATPSQVLCCLPQPSRSAIDFALEPRPRLRVRRPAHLVDRYYIAKYNKAYQLMRDLPATDPRSLIKQADTHCAFCDGAYTQPGSNNKLQVHFSWLFLPWHRWYLYFHERILGKLIGDPSFALVFWNWDNQTDGANEMPAIFLKERSALYDSKRNQAHLPPVLNTLNIASLTDPIETNSQIVLDNLNVMYQSIVTASNPNLFMGQKYSAGDPEPNVGGTLENGPHGAIHAWTGDSREPFGEDMGSFYSAARDPIFFAHHSNVDRLWTVWNSIGGRRSNHTDPDFLDAQFVFYDENANLVKVTVRDALDPAKLGIAYAPVKQDKLWLTYEPPPLSTAPGAKDIPEIGPAAKNKKSTEFQQKLVSRVTRPSEPPKELLEGGLKKDELEEVLVLEDVQVPRNVVTHLCVFINLPDADDKTPLSIAEYVGSFVSIPHFKGSGMMDMRTSTIRFGITDNLKRVGITELSSVIVTVLVKYQGAAQLPIMIKGIKIEYE